jgi:ABC-type bacteriocin/lantibiotic exporter with double-glycine peptidase domain
VYYDGQALSSLDVRAVRQQIGVVLQSSGVLSGSIYENIAGNSGVDLAAAWEAARLAALEPDIRAMPMEMSTILSAGRSTLSGGQQQRLLIARALARRPKLLFFDEATSALDNETQAQVTRALDNLQVTRLVIAHRLSTVAAADSIVVIDRGRIVQQGSYRSLLAAGGAFRELVDRQMV